MFVGDARGDHMDEAYVVVWPLQPSSSANPGYPGP